ncbi:MAG: aspartate/glutamate racemase family protein [Chloracidobacterium sp.]|nr:aspartate/glutamate racemase family protein [Chloracidobacterium sp.]
MGSTQNLVIHKRGTMAGRLGIIDWGIGGVSIYKLIKEQIGDVPVTYLSDTGATPYGKMSRPELTARLDSVIEYLKGRGVTHIIIGCNAASTAIPHLADHAIPVDGVIVPATKMAAKLKPTKLGLIGGRRTVVSGVYRRLLKAQNIEVKQRIAQPLSALIESGDVVSETLRGEAKRILAPLKNCSHILLACTHYPAITPLAPATRFAPNHIYRSRGGDGRDRPQCGNAIVRRRHVSDYRQRANDSIIGPKGLWRRDRLG